MRRLRVFGVSVVAIGLLGSAPTTSAEETGSPAFSDAVVEHPSTSAASGRPSRVEAAARAAEADPRVLGAVAAAGRDERGPVSPTPLTSAWIAQGHTGAGVRIGIIDYFDPAVLATEIAAGELPAIPNSQRTCISNGAICPFGGPSTRHGNAMAEIIADHAPGAELYLAEVGELSDYYLAIDWFATNGVTIVNHSLMDVYDGPGDGTGPRAAIVDYAANHGMAFLTTAGDAAPEPQFSSFQGSYWRGLYRDRDGDRWIEFSTGTDETQAAYCGALMGLRWNDWGAARTDYELWIGDYYVSTRYHGTAVLGSNFNQATGGSLPLEGNDFRWLCNTNPALGPVYDKNKDGFVYLKVRRSAASPLASATSDILELQLRNGWLEYSSLEGSAAASFADSRNAASAAIAATDAFGANGPTNDGRIKPDLTADGCFPTSVYGDCAGDDTYRSSDVATAIASGTAAVVQQTFGPLPAWQVLQYMKSMPAWSGGQYAIPGLNTLLLPNNDAGHGAIKLRGNGPRPTASDQIMEWYGVANSRLIDTRVASVRRPTTAPMLPGSTLAVYVPISLLTGSPERVVVLNVTSVNPTRSSYIQVLSGPDVVPGATSNLNVDQGQNNANLVTTRLENDEVLIYNRAGGHLIVDYVGEFYNRAGHPWDTTFVALDPFRAYDSRCNTCTPLAAGTYRDIQLEGTGDTSNGWGHLPVGEAGTVVVNVTVDSPATGGFLSAVSTSAFPPMTTSTANFQAGRSTTRLAFVQMTAGKIRIYSSATTHIQVDVVGYMSFNANGGWFHAMAPTRVAESRPGPPAPAGTPTFVDLTTTMTLPDNAGAVIGNLTTLGATGPGGLRLGRTADAADATFRSLSIAAAGQTTSTAAITAIDNRSLVIDGDTTAHRILDVFGWFSEAKRLDPSALSPVPASPDVNSANSAALSADGNMVATTGVGAPFRQVGLWNRTTDEVTSFPVIAGESDISSPIRLLAISNDGQRLVFRTDAPNLVPDDTGGTADIFFLDRSTGALSRISATATGVMFQVGYDQVKVDPEVEHVLFLTRTAAIPADTDIDMDGYVRDLLTGEVTIKFDNLPINAAVTAISEDLHTLAWTDNGHSVIQRDDGVTPPQALTGIARSLSPNGQLALETRDNTFSGGRQFLLVTLATNAATNLCFGYSDASGQIDWDVPPAPGTWCQASAAAVLRGTQLISPWARWNGLEISSSASGGAFIWSHGVGLFLMPYGADMVPGPDPTGWQLFTPALS
ncbi:MAG: hypothetical protein ABMA25_09010 [Ilumatobacteraceae bacterium]